MYFFKEFYSYIKSHFKNKINHRIYIVFIIILILEIFNNKECDQFIRYLFMNVFEKIIDIITNEPSFKIALTAFIAYIVKKWFKSKS